MALVLLLIGVTVAGARFGARTDPGRALIVRSLDGLDLGPFGRLRLAGLEGDPFAAFSLKRLSLQDRQGVWLDARGVGADWRPLQLFARTARLERLRAEEITVRRRPDVARAQSASSRLPVSVVIGAFDADLRTAPAFSVRPGDWRLKGRGRLDRSGALAADLTALSRLHAGDGLSLHADINPKGRLSLRASAVESQGGALAGALGLPPEAPLFASVAAAGDFPDLSAARGLGGFGTASARLSSGGARVLEGGAHWSGQTLVANAWLEPGRSRLIPNAAPRFGGPVLLSLRSEPATRETATVTLQLVSPRSRLAAHGPFSWSLRRTAGLDLTVAVADLSAWLPQPRVGAASLRGTVVGAADRFQLQGLFDGRDLSEPGYRSSTVTGPLQVGLEHARWRIKGQLQAARGSGSGPAAGLIGAAPSGEFDLSFSKDGRLLIQSLDLKGRGATLSAAGGQPLGGGLTLKGQLTVNNLALAHPGAAGTAEVVFDAAQAPRSDAWSLSLTAAGSRFNAGVKDLDSALGPTPRLVAAAVWSPAAGLDLQRGSLQGRAGQVDAQGRVDRDRRADLALRWSLKGPLTLGPLEVDGAVKGQGRVLGSPDALALDLDAETPRLAVGALLVTPARLTATLKWSGGAVSGQAAFGGPTPTRGRASLTAEFHGAGETLSLDRLQAAGGGVEISGSAILAQGEVQGAALQAHAGAGAFLQSGVIDATFHLHGQRGGESASLDLTGADIRVAGVPPMQSLKLKAAGPLTALPFSLEAATATSTPVTFSGRGVFSRVGQIAEFKLEGAGRVRTAEYRLLEPALGLLGPDRRSLTARLSIGNGEADVDLHSSRDGVELAGAVKSVSIASFNPDFLGTVSASAHLSGRGGALTGVATGALENARSRDAPAQEALRGEFTGHLEDGRLHLEAKAVNAEGLRSSGVLDAPVKASGSPFVLAAEPDKPLRGSFSADGEIRPLWDLVSGGERSLTGKLATSGSIAGTLARPVVAGEAVLSGGRFKDGGTGLSLQNLQVVSAFDDDGLTVRRFSAADPRSGSISGEGRVSFSDNGASTFTLAVKRFQLLDNDLGRAVASGSIIVTHPARGQGKLSGSLTIDRADIVAAAPTPTGVVPLEVEEIHQPERAGAEKSAPSSSGPPILLDVAIRAPRGIYVKGKGLNVELSLDARVSGTLTRPDLGGSAKVVAGSYDFAGKRFDVATAGSIRLGSTPQQIRLDLTATWQDPTLNAVVKISGTAAKPEIVLTSIPVLPQDEVLARVLFGVSASQLSGAQAAELGSALASLAGGGGFDVIGNLRQFAGLDRLALGSTQNATTTVSGGKYINKDIYLELTGGARNGSGASVEWRIRKNLSLISRYGAALDPRYPNDTDASLSIRFRRDF